MRRRRHSAVAIPARYRNRPARLRACLHRAWSIADDFQLTRGTVAVLQAILATGLVVDNPFRPIYPRKTTLARYADVGQATVYRALRDLEAKDLILRHEQERLEDGTLDITTIQITPRLAAALSLVVDSPSLHDGNSTQQTRTPSSAVLETVGPLDVPTYPEIVAQDTARPLTTVQTPAPATRSVPKKIDGLIAGPICREQNSEPKASVNYQSAPVPFVRIEGRSVAQELLWLITEKRLTFGGLFELQRLAKQVPGQCLSDFVALRSDRIRQLQTTTDCYKYLRTLIAQKLDAKHLLQLRAARQHSEHRAVQRQQAAAARTAWIRARHEQIFVDPTTRTTYRINANHGLLELGHDGRSTQQPSLRLTGRFIQDVQAGRLVPFVASTPTASPARRTEALQAMKTMLKRVSYGHGADSTARGSVG